MVLLPAQCEVADLQLYVCVSLCVSLCVTVVSVWSSVVLLLVLRWNTIVSTAVSLLCVHSTVRELNCAV